MSLSLASDKLRNRSKINKVIKLLKILESNILGTNGDLDMEIIEDSFYLIFISKMGR